MAEPPKDRVSQAPPWEAWELDVVTRTDLTVKERLAMLPHRTKYAIEICRKALGEYPTRGNRRDWQKHETQILRENAHLTNKALMAMLPGRTANAIGSHRRKVLQEIRRPDWRLGDDRYIMAASPDVTDVDLALALGRTRYAVAHRRRLLGRPRPRRPKDILADTSVPPLVQDIRSRARDHGIWLRDLERTIGSQGALGPAHQPKGAVPSTACVRAVELLGGELYAVWED